MGNNTTHPWTSSPVKAEGRKAAKRGNKLRIVLAIPALQDPLAHLRQEGHRVSKGRGGVELGKRESRLPATDLIKFLLHQVSAAATLHQRGLCRAGGGPEAHEALVRAVPQQPHQGI